ncbi:MAG: DUF3887 domain-containing protein [Ruthenibacterium sp.]
MKKILKLTFCLTLCVFLLAACGEKLPEGITEEDVKSHASATVLSLNAKDYDTLNASMTPEMTDALSKSPLADVWEPFAEKLGAFKQIDKVTVGAQKGLAIAVVNASYENAKATFTLSYDADYRLAGLFFK